MFCLLFRRAIHFDNYKYQQVSKICTWLHSFPDLVCQFCQVSLEFNTERILSHCKECKIPIRPDRSFSYVCSFCNYHSHDSGRMRAHIRSHIGDKPFKCDHCSYSSAQKCHLIRHSVIHVDSQILKIKYSWHIKNYASLTPSFGKLVLLFVCER
jgi:hypothetical protein